MIGWLREGVAKVRGSSKQAASRIVTRALELRDRGFYKADQRWVQVTHWAARHRQAVLFGLIGCALAGSALFVTDLQQDFADYFASPARLAGAQTLLVTLGGALVGAAAIAFSVLIFSMQVNIERMPHAVFQRVSSDPVLMFQLAAMILLSIAIGTSSIVIDAASAGFVLICAGWATLAVAALLWLGYLRAIRLIDPRAQLQLVLTVADKEFGWWERRLRRATPLIKLPEPGAVPSTHDWARVTYFKLNPHWTTELRRHMQHAVAYHRNFAATGDYEISAFALNCLLALVAGYVRSKGKSFFHHPGIIDNPDSTDGVINDALEHLRQNVRIAVSRADEQQIEQNLACLAKLTTLLLAIDYAYPYATKHHAQLAAGYLDTAVTTVIPHQMPDVLMEGINLLGGVALAILRHGPDQAAVTVEKIAQIGCVGAARDDMRPVTQVAAGQLARFTITLLLMEGREDIAHAVSETRGSITLLAKVFVGKVKDQPFASPHSHNLAPYFSSTTGDSLLQRLQDAVNAALEDNAKKEWAKTFCRHLSQWAEGEPRSAKELLLLAVEKRSHFTFDVVHWIGHLVEILLAAATAPHCHEHERDGLVDSADRLLWVLSWVPDDAETMRFMATFKLDEIIFEAGVAAFRREAPEVLKSACEGLVSFALKCGRHEDPMHQMESGLRGAMLLAKRGEPGLEAVILAKIQKDLAREGSPSAEMRQSVAREMRERVADVRGNAFDRIDQATGAERPEALHTLVDRVAALLVPPGAQ